MFGVVPKTIWSKMVAPDASNRVPLQTNCVLLSDGRQRVLIETGFGGKWSDKERGFYDLERRTIVDALRESGIDAMDIDHVVLSHLHFDHAGGLTHLVEGEPTSTFARARIHVQKREWEDALANRAVMTRTYLRSHLDPVSAQIELYDGRATVLEGISVEPAPGHTWGQQIIRVEIGGAPLVFLGDVMPTTNHVGAAFSLAYDIEPYTAMQTKLAMQARAARERWRIVLDHDSHHALVRVEVDPDQGGRYRVVPE